MNIISSQRYLDQEIVDEKEVLGDVTLVAYKYDDNTAILADGHHTLAAARKAGVNVRFEITEHPEMLKGDDLLESMYMDSEYYDIETGINYF